ncbi:serine/arginine repetitive matrix protein 1-like [Chiroxiphia lanceolata]|uniref:serine/arginine repetitive matrix protein 1-like n=1 Tax=Chiroxiphia lanceolata TaxID=296741 RepID=UPI0013CF27AD|nr:serine/arginine repetitive matrix protein 1-like [Chiroxiphia lanceolata]
MRSGSRAGAALPARVKGRFRRHGGTCGSDRKSSKAPARKSAKPTVKMAPPGPELGRDNTINGGPGPEVRPEATLKKAPQGPQLSRGHTKEGGERTPLSPPPIASERHLSCCLASAPIRTPAPRPQHCSPRRFPRRQPPLGAAARGGRARTLGAHTAPPARTQRRLRAPFRSAPAPLGPAVPWRCSRGCAAAFSPRKRPTAADPTEIVPGAPSFPSVAVDVPDASGRTNPVALRSGVPCACSILYKTKLPFLVGMDWPGFGNLAPRKTEVTSSKRGRLSGKRCQKELEFLVNKSWKRAPENPPPLRAVSGLTGTDRWPWPGAVLREAPLPGLSF